ncbi:hypothetical protein B0I35DRAFT_267675 [Stachybotrys elegans]|uniref:C2H2-type domain-containing protein n=1 Tax=Stachybotrys elegans TaxID=80388 RepID=A0A8K0SQR2_9HYPO|nr:hypothetical protein B0I35DRAFT_267675 [Stachybotrys elegans]
METITNHPGSISSSARDCRDSFTELCHALRKSPYTRLESIAGDEAGRFDIWAGNIGAYRDEESLGSLDSRLKSAELILANVHSGLARLSGAIKRATSIATGDLPDRTTEIPTSKDTIDQAVLLLAERLAQQDLSNEVRREATTEMTELFLNIQSCVGHLFALSILIRRDRPRGRTRPHQFSQQEIDSGPDTVHLKDKFPKLRGNPWLAGRLGLSIAQQREYIRYRQSHRRSLSKSNDNVGDDGQSVLTTKATTFEQPLSNSEIDMTTRSMYSGATTLASTAQGELSSGRRIPHLTDMRLDGVQLAYGKHIECPYCRTIQVIKNRNHWKHHVYSDLQLYVCTFQGCSAEPFSTSHQWFRHEMEHRKRWNCHLCREVSTSTAQFKVHLKISHSVLSNSQLEILVKACEKAWINLDEGSCPFLR